MSDHNRYDKITSDGDFTFLINCFIPLNKNNTRFLEQLRALWTALCIHHGVDDITGGEDYAKGLQAVKDALNRQDEEFDRYMAELLDIDDDDEDDD